jgi:hypothetical protein
MNEQTSFLWSTILPAVLSAIAPAALWALKKAGDYFRAKADDTSTSAAARATFNALDQLDVLAKSVVEHFNTEVKEKMARYMADGMLSPEEAADLKASAMVVLTANAGPAMTLLKNTLGSLFELVVSGAIEKAVKEANREKLENAAKAGEAAAAKVQSLADAAAVLK